MSNLQWALLILGIVVVIAVIVMSLRDRRGSGRRWTPPSAPATRSRVMPGSDQMDIFGATGQFDEFGVGRPRRKSAVNSPVETSTIGASADLFSQSEPAKSDEPPVPEFVRNRQSPSMGSATPAGPSAMGKRPPTLFTAPTAAPAPAPSAAISAEASEYEEPASDDTIIVLFVVEQEGVAIPGPKLHEALRAHGFEFGAKQIYHRMQNGMVQFSIANIIKPGDLDPARAAEFSTPGLTVFLTLPGPIKPVAALEEMFIACDRLAGSLNAEVFDQQRQSVSENTRRELRERVATWARKRNLA